MRARATKQRYRQQYAPSGAGGFSPAFASVADDAADYSPAEAMGRIRGHLGITAPDNHGTVDAVRRAAAALRLADALADAAEKSPPMDAHAVADAINRYREARTPSATASEEP